MRKISSAATSTPFSPQPHRNNPGRCLVGSDGIIGVTAHHPLWSATRGAWVSAAELEPGEHLRGIGEGAGVVVAVASLLPRGQEPVYNIEVEGDHCYRVGEQGLLVHNSSVPCDQCKDDPAWGLPTTGQQNFSLMNITVTVPLHPSPLFPVDPGSENVGVISLVKFRAEGHSFNVTGFPGTGTSQSSRSFTKRFGKPGDHAGHVIANSFGGTDYIGVLGNNIFPLNGSVNNSGWKIRGENVCKNLVANNNIVCARIMFTYGDPMNPARPKVMVWDFLYQKTPTDPWQTTSQSPITNT
ncbi:hypothetical protein [Tuwongella immobilis]|uniref:Uncharacterized protein n=1 Tax=Tuwongella immobilis TaxID=692036 RepID=A0A6C2YRI7_9BACT|nr:hypothetical protein [Tuwongella immobilis]VIP03733.1 Uncharacterized protein OS=Planctomyces maris DSM 8797 GN=PM8797T_02039 PE=4 SV=1: PT-HINT [Tuwongella immobilis]VTS04834.1 Uncharacterized protein OS=Planctomyces maris DSM 8797 GN=PM8797T_02039 PE=4 SV=1: PT-HINT [Tuwongella immobilis]